ncbi:hypothetical protein HQ531_04970, partial [bacterium]|nr:hypothetical protein [bacterium]
MHSLNQYSRLLLFALFSGAFLFAQDPEEFHPYWVFFHDKEVTDMANFDPSEHEFPQLTQRALDRRAVRGKYTEPTYYDLDVAQTYIDNIAGDDIKVRIVSRWLNAISIIATQDYIDGLEENTIVKKTKRIHKMSKRMVKSITREEAEYYTDADYGDSYGQSEQINAISAHQAGFTGTDVWLLMVDTGYFTDHLAFQQERIVAEYDFIQADSVTQNEEGDSNNQHNHGTATASAAGGFIDGVLRGIAYECRYLLAKTEIMTEEIQAEEDYYVAALEWGEA